jgi:hypothetical protein
MEANPRINDSSCSWVDVSDLAAGGGLAAQVCISRAAWLDAVYLVREAGDRLDPVRENWRMRRLLEEVCSAVDTRGGPGPDAHEFTLSLEEGFDRLRCLALPGARLKVRVEHEHDSPEIWVDVAGGRALPGGRIVAGH